ncbi:hypothetical protein GJ496_002478, partial [Pomphorhynchus laevis]
MYSTFVDEGIKLVAWIVGDPIELLGALKHADAKRATSKDKRRLRFANNPGYSPMIVTNRSGGWPRTFAPQRQDTIQDCVHNNNVDLYPLSNYTFGTKDPLYERDSSVAA